MKKIALLVLLFSSLSYAQNETKLFEVYENKSEQDVRLEAVREGDQILFRKTEGGDIVSNSEVVQDIVAPRGPSVSDFYYLVSKKDYLMIEDSLSHGVNADTKLYAGNTALHLASSWDDRKMVDLLLKYNANAKMLNNKGETPLHMACGYAGVEIIQSLLSQKTKSISEELNRKTKNGRTCMHFAALGKSPEVAKYIAAQKPDFSLKDENGQTPGHFAVATGNFKILYAWLKSKSINIQDKDKYETSVEDYMLNKSDIFTRARLYPYFSNERKAQIKESIRIVGNIGEIED